MRVLSLFDGISCGQVALERAGIPVEVYYASEIDKYAIQITQKNYPNTIQLGDVTKIDFKEFIGKVDLVIGGSPCQDLSIAGKRAGLQGDRSGLFYKFVEAIDTIKPKYFLLENNVGMPQDAYEEISRLMGCYPIEINSALLSAQTRKRYYWTNIGPQNYNLFGFPTVAIPQPKNKGILLKDVLESGYGVAVEERGTKLNYSQHKASCLMARDYKGFRNQQMTGVAEPICINISENVTVRKYEVDTEKLKTVLREHKNLTNKEIAEKLNQPITKVEHWFRTDNSFAIPDAEIWLQIKALLNIQTDEFDKSITEFETKEGSYDKATRKYSVNGKMSTLMAAGNDEIIQPLKIPENTVKGYAEINQGECMDLTHLNSKTRRGRAMKEKCNCLQTQSEFYQYLEPLQLGHISNTNAQANRVYSVHNKSVTLKANGGGGGAKTGLYKIDLPDGEYLIRKLTPLECERLQTLPDGYTQSGMSYYYYNIYDIINMVIKGEQLCKNVKLKDVKILSQTEKQGYAINIIYDISDMEQQNLQEILLNEKKNVLLMDVITSDKQERDIVLNTIKDLKEQEQQNLIKMNLKNVNIAVDWQLQEECVIGTIKIGCDTEMQNIQIKLEKEQIITDIKNLKENIEYNIEKLLQKYWGEIYHLKKLYTILIWINLIMIKKIYMYVIKMNTQAYISNLIELQGNSLKLELSNLKMADIIPISSTQRYKTIGNGWTVDVIAHIFSFIE